MSNYCKIGQKDRCKKTGCEWKKSFRHCCSNGYREEKILVNKKPERVVKKENFPIEKGDGIWNKIGTVKSDPWISKIKTL